MVKLLIVKFAGKPNNRLSLIPSSSFAVKQRINDFLLNTPSFLYLSYILFNSLFVNGTSSFFSSEGCSGPSDFKPAVNPGYICSAFSIYISIAVKIESRHSALFFSPSSKSNVSYRFILSNASFLLLIGTKL